MIWHPLTSAEQLDAILAESATQPVAIFKHSTTCSISATAKARLDRQWDAAIGDGIKLYYLDLLRYRPVSNAVAAQLRVVHESPQLLLIQDGVCTYDASHMDIRAEAVKGKVRK
ncbi:MAG: bacillithiol system redox-active protein YtxJ [Hymenobacteraceae bacterium]|nr:bacillithiol system redox-active protein YtxJ [Hymenobacteraceae bacterium]